MGKQRRAGRKPRQDVERDSEGRIAASEYRGEEHDARTTAEWNRARDVMRQLARDPRLGSQLGMLFYQRRITPAQFEAGNRWADMLEGYDLIVLGRRRTAPSPALERLGMGEPPEMDPERVMAFRRRFSEAHDALLCAGKLAEVATGRLCREEGIGGMEREALAGLDRLVEHFGLEGR